MNNNASTQGAQSRRAFFATSVSTGLAIDCLLRSSRTVAGQESITPVAPRIAHGDQGAVATVSPLASQAAMAAYERGGNAMDAAIAASLMLSVVDGFNSGIGGGCLALVRRPSGEVYAIDGREKAPEQARPEMFFRDGKPSPQLSQIGPLAAGVPGLLAALHRMAESSGVISWNAALLDAAQVAEDGFSIDANYARRLASVAKQLKQFPESARILLDSSGNPRKSGERLQQPDLASTLRRIANGGVEWFYQGEFAERTAKFLRSQGGVMSHSDFANYHTVLREPIRTGYRNRQVVGFPPPSSGGIHVCQMLGMLEHYDVRSIFSESEARGRHLLLEVMKRAMADRAHWLGDADFTSVPRGLIDKDYLKQRARSIDLNRATIVASHGQPPRKNIDLFGRGGHTTHLTTADRDGNVVALTQTVNTTFGCKMIVPGTGVVLNNEMDDFSIAPGVRNAFGLVGSKANLIAPGKRPLSSMSPTLVLDDSNHPVISCGAAGGPKIITTALQILVRVLDLEETIDQAIAAPRTHHQWSPDQAVCEQTVSDEVCDSLESRGHQISRIRSAAVAQGLEFDGETITVASDPRVPSSAMAY